MENKKQGKKEKKKGLNYLTWTKNNRKVTNFDSLLSISGWERVTGSKCLLKRTKGKMLLELKCKLRTKYVIFIQMPNLLNMSFHSSNVIILFINLITK